MTVFAIIGLFEASVSDGVWSAKPKAFQEALQSSQEVYELQALSTIADPDLASAEAMIEEYGGEIIANDRTTASDFVADRIY